MRPYPTIPEQASDKELLQLALEYMGHRTSCSLPASNFQKHQQCKCGKDALVALIKKSASENRTRLDGIEEAARLLDDTRLEMRAPGNLADYGRGVLKDAAAAIRRLKEIK